MRWCALWLVLAPCLASAANWYWRPNSATYGQETGSTYQDAWSKSTQIDWSRMRDGDTLFICGRHDTGYLDRELLTGRGGITLTGACPGDPGELISVGTRFMPGQWLGPNEDGVYHVPYSGSPSSAMDESGQMQRLDAVPTAKSPCRSYFHAAGELYYRPCGTPRIVYPTGGGPVVRIRHDRVTLEDLLIRNSGTAIEVKDASGVVLRRLHILEHTGIGILLVGRTSDGKILSNEIHGVTDGIYAVTRGDRDSAERHDGWLVEDNYIHDVAGSGDAHAIGWQTGSDNVFRRNRIERAAGSGITIYAWRTHENSRNIIEDNEITDVIRKSVESNQRGIELSGDNCWESPEIRQGDSIRNNRITNVTEGIYVKAMSSPGGGVPVRIEGNRIKARQTGIRWASPNGGPAPRLQVEANEVEALQRLKPVDGPRDLCR
jgi:hypothetical protein